MNTNKILLHYDHISILFPYNCKRKNYFLAACQTLDPHVDLFEVDILCKYGGKIGIGNSKVLEPLLNNSKVVRLHAILHDASGFMKSEYDVGSGYCYMFSRCPINICFLGHVSGLTYCSFLKIFKESLYKRLDC